MLWNNKIQAFPRLSGDKTFIQWGLMSNRGRIQPIFSIWFMLTVPTRCHFRYVVRVKMSRILILIDYIYSLMYINFGRPENFGDLRISPEVVLHKLHYAIHAIIQNVIFQAQCSITHEFIPNVIVIHPWHLHHNLWISPKFADFFQTKILKKTLNNAGNTWETCNFMNLFQMFFLIYFSDSSETTSLRARRSSNLSY